MLAERRPELRGLRRSSSSSTSSGSPRPWIPSATTPTRCGTRRTASSTTCCGSPTARGERLKVRSLVGLLPLCADDRHRRPSCSTRFPHLREQRRRLPRRNRTCSASIADPAVPGVNGRRLLSLVNEDKLRRMLAPHARRGRFLGPHGIRSLSRSAPRPPVRAPLRRPRAPRRATSRRSPTAACSAATPTGGGRCGSRSTAIIRALLQLLPVLRRRLHHRVPHRLGPQMTLFEVAQELGRRLIAHLRARRRRQRPVYGGTEISRPTRTGATCCSSTSTSTATTARAWARSHTAARERSIWSDSRRGSASSAW